MQRSHASPRPSGGESPSKSRDGFSLFGGSAGGKHKADGSRMTNLLVALSVLLNVVVIGLLITRCIPGSSNGAAVVQEHTPTSLAVDSSAATAELVAAHARELETLQASLNLAQRDLNNALNAEREAEAQLKELSTKHEHLVEKYDQLKQSAGNEAIVIPPSASGDCPCKQQSRLDHDDLALQGDKFDMSSHEFEWACNDELISPRGNQTYCPETATSEQYFQLTFFDRPGAGSKVAVRGKRPVSPLCVQLPPIDYQWPVKHAPIPVLPGTDAVHWPNLRVATLRDLLVFNRGTPKNLYHFNASFYDYEQEQIVAHAARYIPFDQKIRVMMDIGSGGGSLGLLLKRRYDVQVISTVFADWPYCEYISERGNLCMYLDAMEAMPFAKFTYDLLHSSWVFHALLNHQLVHTFLEQNRVLRPGGYIWLNGGWSESQVETMEDLFINQLGYKKVYDHKKPVPNPGRTSFDTIPFELEWEVIMVKPIRAAENCRVAQAEHNAGGTNRHGRS